MPQTKIEPPSSPIRRSTRLSTIKTKRPLTADLLATDTLSMPTKSRTRPSVRNTKAPAPTTKPSKPSKGHARSRGAIYYNHKIAFYGGILSNFHIGKPFRGITILKHVLPTLRDLAITHPAASSVATQMIVSHNFICGEQVMMAMKSYLFECPALPAANESLSDEVSAEWLDELNLEPEAFAGMQGTNLSQVLSATDPKKIKALGRKCPNFDPGVWNRVSPSVVTVACLARAKANVELAEIYNDNLDFEAVGKVGGELRLKRGFVEGSPSDRIWGAGMAFDDARIDYEKNWKGGNRLGKCHDEACLLLGRSSMDGASEMEHEAAGAPRKEQARGDDEVRENQGSVAKAEETTEQTAQATA